MSIEIIIRKYSSEDAQALANIYYHTIHQINIRDYTLEQVEAWAPEKSLDGPGWSKKFERTNPYVTVVLGQVVGFAEFELNGYIDCFYCHHQWIGCGVGSALMDAILEEAKQKKIKRIFVEVSITTKPFFEKCGFMTIAEQTVMINGIGLNNYKMEKLIEYCE